MAVVRVGVRRLEGGTSVACIGDPGVEAFTEWIEINGQRFGHEWKLLSVSHEATGQDVGKVTIELISEGYSTVDHREPESAGPT